MSHFIKPLEPVYWPKEERTLEWTSTGRVVKDQKVLNVAGWRTYRELMKTNPLVGVTYVTRTRRDQILYVGSGGWRRPFDRHHSNRMGCTDGLGFRESVDPNEDTFVEVLAIATSKWLAQVLESVVCELAQPPLNVKKRILPSDRHLMERDAATAFWNRNYASRFGLKATWPYGWGASSKV